MVEKGGLVESFALLVGQETYIVATTPASLTEGISMHSFPYDDNVKRKWTQFVRKHRPGFKPSVHFSKDCFTRPTDLLGPQNVSGAISKSTRMVKGSIPTIDIAG